MFCSSSSDPRACCQTVVKYSLATRKISAEGEVSQKIIKEIKTKLERTGGGTFVVCILIGFARLSWLAGIMSSVFYVRRASTLISTLTKPSCRHLYMYTHNSVRFSTLFYFLLLNKLNQQQKKRRLDHGNNNDREY